MKRCLTAALTLLLVGCGSVSTAPTAGQLLDAPSTLNVGGTLLGASAWPTLSNTVLSVRVRVQSARSALPPRLSINTVYVVTNDGVWSTPLSSSLQWKCGSGCALGVGRGPAGDLQVGQGVQVVLGLSDAQGRSFLLRSGQAKIAK